MQSAPSQTMTRVLCTNYRIVIRDDFISPGQEY